MIADSVVRGDSQTPSLPGSGVTHPPSRATPSFRAAGLVIATLAMVGMAEAFYVARSSYTGQTMWCIFFDGCNAVTQSPYARLFGVPMSYFGVIYYLCSFGLAVLLAVDPFSRGLRYGVLAFTGIGVAYSAFSMVLQVRFIRAICSYCVISAVITVLLLAVALWHFRRTRNTVVPC